MTEEATHSKASGRVPPQDLEAEKSLLGAILISDGALPEILTILKPRDFYEERHQLIFEAMTSLYDQNKPVDLLKVTT